MNLTHRFKCQSFLILVSLSGLLFSLEESKSQLIVDMKLKKTNYLAYEPMEASVTVYNRAGNDIVLGGPKGRGWMTFDV